MMRDPNENPHGDMEMLGGGCILAMIVLLIIALIATGHA